MLKKVLKNERGLTLVELLAVIVILGIVAAIAIPSIGSIIQKSKEDAYKADAIQVLNAAKTYVASNGIPDGNSITKQLLDPFVSDVDLPDGYTVAVTDDGKVFELTAAAKKVGTATITFTGATTSEIDADKEKGTRTIGVQKEEQE
ncbi:prepilin-type N-terminal cleavage/methylation domain-containing protein [Ectobacillus antri]|uniref:Prepilin-type N-terminal cleavage/methylation domain-containing protein n=1 Tax=Ectobacillus antri TaxID=2486280 RepID=A0ABT6H414_9BACI|nr:prepilin-type N-terminal cleavage/methylation domain-containing protein [Ectobacillus antri]MDG4657462.1 prepilin-type N-terminal cleavage/methylation domain-containing protein [Ectobacillus antri]MDG5753775.1 prepilin-type N-terminal cleavage/methylation domain-containing protein [Ectobacillus antri]